MRSKGGSRVRREAHAFEGRLPAAQPPFEQVSHFFEGRLPLRREASGSKGGCPRHTISFRTNQPITAPEDVTTPKGCATIRKPTASFGGMSRRKSHLRRKTRADCATGKDSLCRPSSVPIFQVTTGAVPAVEVGCPLRAELQDSAWRWEDLSGPASLGNRNLFVTSGLRMCSWSVHAETVTFATLALSILDGVPGTPHTIVEGRTGS